MLRLPAASARLLARLLFAARGSAHVRTKPRTRRRRGAGGSRCHSTGGSERSGSAAAGLAVAGRPPAGCVGRDQRVMRVNKTTTPSPPVPSQTNRKARELARTACLIWNAAHRMTTGPSALVLLALLALAAAVPAARLNRDSTDRPEVRNRPRPAPAACAPLPHPYTEMRVVRIVCRGMLLRGARPGS